MSTITRSTTQHRQQSSRGVRVALVVGYLALAVGVLAAQAAPATSYEPSPYTATPMLFWVGLLVATTVGFATSALGGRLGRYCGLGLAGLASVAFLALPFLRSYYFYGSGDALTHLGWAKAMLGPDFGFFNLIYPGGHALSISLAQMMGVPVRHGLMYAMLAVSVVTLVFVPLSVWVVLREPRAIPFALFTAMLMHPINNISTNPHFHSFTLTTLFFPFVLYLAFKHITREADDDSLPEWLSAVSLVAPIALAAVVFYHPQVAANVLILFGTILAIGVTWRRIAPADHDATRFRHRLLLGQVVVLGVIFVYWALQYENTLRLAANTLNELAAFFITGEGIGEVAQEKGDSARSLGVSLWVLFAKLFLVEVTYVVVATGLVVAKLLGRLDKRENDSGMTITYLGLSGLTLGPFFATQFVGDVSTYFFRHLGFALVLVGILSAIALYSLSSAVARVVRTRGRVVVSVVAVLVLCLSLVAYFPSPYIYLPSAHTPETQFVGYQTTFDHLPDETPLAKVRIDPGRFTDALNADVPGRLLWALPGDQMDSVETITQYRENDRTDVPAYYLVVSERDQRREVVGFHGIRYQSDDFQRVETTTPRLSRIQSNGDYRLYYVDQRGLSLAPTTDG
jgi:hypothetical protein